MEDMGLAIVEEMESLQNFAHGGAGLGAVPPQHY